MQKAILHFADKSTLELHEGDRIIPIVRASTSKGVYASMDQSVELYEHIHNGLIPSIMDALCKCDFFYALDNYDIAYSAHSIVKIELS